MTVNPDHEFETPMAPEKFDGRLRVDDDEPTARRAPHGQPGNGLTMPKVETPYGPQPGIPGSTLGDIEKFAILSTLEACGGSTHRAAAMLDVSVRMIQYRLREYRHGIKRAPSTSRDAQDEADAAHARS